MVKEPRMHQEEEEAIEENELSLDGRTSAEDTMSILNNGTVFVACLYCVVVISEANGRKKSVLSFTFHGQIVLIPVVRR